MKTAEELFADGLITSLKLEQGRTYILVFDRRAISPDHLVNAGKYLYERLGINAILLGVRGDATSAICGVEIVNG